MQCHCLPTVDLTKCGCTAAPWCRRRERCQRIPCHEEAIVDEVLIVACARPGRRAPHRQDGSIAALQSVAGVVPGRVVTHCRTDKHLPLVPAPLPCRHSAPALCPDVTPQLSRPPCNCTG